MKLENLEKAKAAQAEYEKAMKEAAARRDRSLDLASLALAREVAARMAEERNEWRFKYCDGTESFCKLMDEQIPIYRKAAITASQKHDDEVGKARAEFTATLARL